MFSNPEIRQDGETNYLLQLKKCSFHLLICPESIFGRLLKKCIEILGLGKYHYERENLTSAS